MKIKTKSQNMRSVTRRIARAAAVVGLVLFALSAVAGDPITVTTWDHDGDGEASGNGADAMFRRFGPDANHGADVNMGCAWASSNDNLRNLPVIRFDLSHVQNLASATNAALQVYDYRYLHARKLDGQTLYAIILTNQTYAAWGEMDITWNTPPINHCDQADFDPIDGEGMHPDEAPWWMPLDSFASQVIDSNVDGWQQPWVIDATALQRLKDHTDVNGFVTFRIIRANDDGTVSLLATKETAQKENTDTTPVPVGSLAPRLLLSGANWAPSGTMIILR